MSFLKGTSKLTLNFLYIKIRRPTFQLKGCVKTFSV